MSNFKEINNTLKEKDIKDIKDIQDIQDIKDIQDIQDIQDIKDIKDIEEDLLDEIFNFSIKNNNNNLNELNQLNEDNSINNELISRDIIPNNKKKYFMNKAKERLKERSKLLKNELFKDNLKYIIDNITNNKFNFIYFITTNIISINDIESNIFNNNYSKINKFIYPNELLFKIKEKINKNIPDKYIIRKKINVKEGFDKELKFIDIKFLINKFDEIFGKFGWDINIKKIDYDDINKDSVYTSSIISIKLYNELIHENYGNSFYISNNENIDLIKLKSLQYSLIDSFRRTAKDFGNIFGLELYSKEN